MRYTAMKIMFYRFKEVSMNRYRLLSVLLLVGTGAVFSNAFNDF
jgi:hypothetical protein